ncbi:MAG: NAD(+)/NADH kinase [Gemmatimonadota bacterium]|nr:NAD(+)/NADH kinase [Gemmatimonadota bacterium]
MRVGLVGSPGYPDLPAVVDRVRLAAGDSVFQLFADEVVRSAADAEWPDLDSHLGELDALLTLGGDGTLLRGAGLAGPHGLPVLGCNLGKLGFLTAGPLYRLEEMLEHLKSGTLVEDKRLALEVRAVGRSWYAVNDAVVHKSGAARLLRMRVWIDGDAVGQYSADGIILSTATGSTAYSLSAGGPILVPSLDAIVAAPICPHSLAIRPLVVGADSTIEIDILSGMRGTLVSVDGEAQVELAGGDRVSIRRSPHSLRLLRLPDDSFFSVLRRKLRWGDVRPDEE